MNRKPPAFDLSATCNMMKSGKGRMQLMQQISIPFSRQPQAQATSTPDTKVTNNLCSSMESEMNHTLEMEIVELKLELAQCRTLADERDFKLKKSADEKERLKNRLREVLVDREDLRARNEQLESNISLLKEETNWYLREKDELRKKCDKLDKEKDELKEEMKRTSEHIDNVKQDAKQTTFEHSLVLASEIQLIKERNELKSECENLKSENEQIKDKMDSLKSAAGRAFRKWEPIHGLENFRQINTQINTQINAHPEVGYAMVKKSLSKKKKAKKTATVEHALLQRTVSLMDAPKRKARVIDIMRSKSLVPDNDVPSKTPWRNGQSHEDEDDSRRQLSPSRCA